MDLLERLEALGEIIAEAEMLAEGRWTYGNAVTTKGGTQSVKIKKGAFHRFGTFGTDTEKKVKKGVEGYFVTLPYTNKPVFITTKRPKLSPKSALAKKFGQTKGGALAKNAKRAKAARGVQGKGNKGGSGWFKRKRGYDKGPTYEKGHRYKK